MSIEEPRAMADITILNLNMLYVRYFDSVERELHIPLGPLYVTSALERAGFSVDFRDYQLHDAEELFSPEEILRFLDDSAPIVGFSCMANLLPFTLLSMRAFKEAHPEKTLILAGVGPKSVEHLILERFDWVDLIVRGESEELAPKLLAALQAGAPLQGVPGVSFRDEQGHVVHTDRPPRIADLDSIAPPAYHKIDLSRYSGYGVITSRGCPYPCTFCSVAPVWDLKSYHRSATSILDEMRTLHEEGGAELILFQDEFFVSGKRRVQSFCDQLDRSGLDLKWKAFGRINLTDPVMMEAMERTGCVEIRFGIESGSDAVLEKTRKGFKAAESIDVVRRACEIFRRVDAFYVWGFPFETMDDFYASVFQMVSFRMMGARILPSLLCLLPQTQIFKEEISLDRLQFAPDLLPEYMITGHEISRFAHIDIKSEHQSFFDFVKDHPDIFPGFFHVDLEENIRPKLRVLQELGFYPASAEELAHIESCGAHSPKVAPEDGRRELATRSSL
jgi:anaerobic magnesium-protoporphyrin IX monomethyl ester cyclase